jgi:hypothetical protein
MNTVVMQTNKRAWLWLAGGVVIVVGAALFGPFLARSFIDEGAYDACIDVVSDATPEICRCMAAKVADRMVTFDYFHRRLVRNEDLPRDEMERIRRGCGLAAVSLSRTRPRAN